MAKRKNIIFYFSDQQRWDTVNETVTPNLMQLAKEGTLFENNFTCQPVCGPARACLQTGVYATQCGCYWNGIPLPESITPLAHYFNEAGYDTAYVGKWHLASDRLPGIGTHCEATPVPKEKQGEYRYWRAADVLEFTSHGYDGFVFDENDNRIDFTGYRVDCITDFALEFLEQYRGEKPFFMTVSHIEPHHQNDHHHYEGPIGSKEKYANFTSPKDLEVLGGNHREEYPDYLGQCASLDKNLGRLVNKLKEMGIYEDTVIIYLADHGSHFMTRNQDAHLNGYDDYKRSMHDACLRVPLVVTGGEFTGGGVVTDLISTAGLPRTILGIAGVDVGDKMIGEDFADVLHKTDPDRPNEVFAQISESRVGRAIRTADYAYSVYAPGINGGAQPAADLYADDFFYDLKKDPYELNNLIDDPAYTQVKQELRKKLLKWIHLAENAEPEIVDG